EIGNQDADLQVKDADEIEVHVVEIEPEIVPAHVLEQLAHGGRGGPVGVVLSIDQLLTVGRFQTLIAELHPRKADTGDGNERGADDRPGKSYEGKALAYLTHNGQLCHMGGEDPEKGQEG